MKLKKVIERINKEHELLKQMLIESIDIILEEGVEAYVGDKQRFLEQAKTFLKNYVQLIKPHFKFEETYLFTALPNKYNEVIPELIQEHRYILELIEQAEEYINAKNINGVVRTLRKLHKIETQHTNKVDTIIKELTSKNRPNINTI